MSSRRLRIGEHGTISFSPKGSAVTASLYYRDASGVRRRLEATASNKTAAKRELLAKLTERLSGATADVNPRTTFADLADEWFVRFSAKVDEGLRAPTTRELYRRALDVHLLPRIGRLRLAELTPPRLDAALEQLRAEYGYATTKTARSVLSSVCRHAVQTGALATNPVRDVGSLEQPGSRSARALTREEANRWLEIVDGSDLARRHELDVLSRFMLATGCRVGEALGARWEDFDLTAGTWQVRRTIVRVRGAGLVASKPKTSAGLRTLWLPESLRDLLITRSATATGPLVFPDSIGGYRDRNNVEAVMRRVRAGTELDWVIPHTFRKTVATRLDEAGLSARMVADQLGHSRVSMTQDTYFGRGTASPLLAAALDLPSNTNQKENHHEEDVH